jgi:3-hydroxybutyryl-CoA dehydrogenase
MEFNKLFVLGAGTMGSGIAQVGLQSGMSVTVCDSFPPALEKAKTYFAAAFAKLVAKNRMTEEEKADCLKRLAITDQISLASDADLVIEAIKEDQESKKAAFAQLSEICRPDAILCSNTSSISISAMSAAVKNPGRFLGTHFFNPVPIMKLLEIVEGISTAPETIAAVKEIGAKWGKVCIVSKDSSGFIANRIGSPMLNAAINVLDAGIGSKEDIDAAMKYGWGWPMGPLELLDMVGLDVQEALMEVFYEEYGDPYYKPAPLLKRMVAAGRLGRKSGKGFFDYTK